MCNVTFKYDLIDTSIAYYSWSISRTIIIDVKVLITSKCLGNFTTEICIASVTIRLARWNVIFKIKYELFACKYHLYLEKKNKPSY